MFFPNVGGEFFFRQKVFYKNVNLQYSFTISSKSRGVEVFQAELPNPRIKAFCNVCTSTSKESPRAAPILDILVAMGRRITYHPYQPPKLITYHHAQRSKDGEKNAIKLRCLEDLSNARNLKCPVCSLKSGLHVL